MKGRLKLSPRAKWNVALMLSQWILWNFDHSLDANNYVVQLNCSCFEYLLIYIECDVLGENVHGLLRYLKQDNVLTFKYSCCWGGCEQTRAFPYPNLNINSPFSPLSNFSIPKCPYPIRNQINLTGNGWGRWHSKNKAMLTMKFEFSDKRIRDKGTKQQEMTA